LVLLKLGPTRIHEPHG